MTEDAESTQPRISVPQPRRRWLFSRLSCAEHLQGTLSIW